MNDKEKYPLLIGRSMIGNRRLHNTAEAADFICMSAEYGDTTITDVNGITVLTTYGMYIDKAVDTEYRDELLKALKPKQEELVGAENCLINGGEKEYAQNFDRRAEEYLKTEAYKNDFAEIRGIYNRTHENKSDEEIKQMVIGRFKTQCIKEDNTKRHQKIKAMVKEYLNSAEFETDFNIEINNYIARGEEVPPDRQIREMLKEGCYQRYRREMFCEENGHSRHEVNPDIENGTSDMECNCCGGSQTIGWM